MATFTGKQQAFIDAYLGVANFNATRAADIAGYKGNGVTLATVGYDNIRKPHIADEIAKRLQASAMTADELVMRLGEQARVDVTGYYDKSGKFNLTKFKQDGYGYLIKSIKKDKAGNLVIDFIDKLRSQELIARHLKLLTDKIEQETVHKLDENNIDALRDRIFSIKTKRGNQLDTE